MANSWNFTKTNIFAEFIDSKTDLGVNISVFGYESCTKNKVMIGPISKNHYMMHYVIDGKGFYTIGNNTYTIEQNTLFFAPPNIQYSYLPDRKDPWKYFWVEFNGAKCKELISRSGLVTDNPVYSPKSQDEIFDSFLKMLKTVMKNSALLDIECTSGLLNVLAIIAEELKIEEKQIKYKNNKKILEIVEYIHLHYFDSELNLQNISKKTFFNPSYLSRAFKDVTGNSITKYIIDLRMQKACALLKEKHYSVSEVAYSVGYKNPFYFSLEFKRLFGLSPIAYKKEN